MLGAMMEFTLEYSQVLINLLALVVIVALTFTAKNKDIGVLVSCYYAVYICLELSYFGFVGDWHYLTFDKWSLWYLICFCLTLIIFISSLNLFTSGNNVAGLYALWLFVALTVDGFSSVFQIVETNILLIVYNGVQNISVIVDLFVVFIGMDHIIKRKFNAASVFINYITCRLESWRSMVVLLLNKGAKCSKKKSIN